MKLIRNIVNRIISLGKWVYDPGLLYYSIAMVVIYFGFGFSMLFFPVIENKFVTLLLAIQAIGVSIIDLGRTYFEKDTEKSKKAWTITASVILFLSMLYFLYIIYCYLKGIGKELDVGNTADAFAYTTVGYFFLSMLVRIREK